MHRGFSASMGANGGFRRRAAVLAIIAALALTAVPGPVGTADHPDGLGPECGTASMPCTMEPGTHNGTLLPTVNERDHYTFTPPADPAVLRIEATADTVVQVEVRDPDGTLRASGSNLFVSPIRADAVARPAGPWSLTVGYHPAGSAALLGNSYTVSLEYEAFDHVASAEGPGGLATTLTAEFPADRVRLDAVYRTSGSDHVTSSSAFAHVLAVNTTEWGFVGSSISQRCCGLMDPRVRTWGVLPEDHDIDLPVPGSGPSSLGVLGVENGGAAFHLSSGLTYSRGLGPVQVWMAWDNETAPVLAFPDGNRAFYHRVGDLEGDGPGIYAAGYAYAEDLHRTEEMPGTDTHLSVLTVLGITPGLSMEPARIFLERPDGERVDASGQWLPHHFVDIDEGPWRVDVEHLDGLERDRILFWGASFPIDLDWFFDRTA